MLICINKRVSSDPLFMIVKCYGKIILLVKNGYKLIGRTIFEFFNADLQSTSGYFVNQRFF